MPDLSQVKTLAAGVVILIAVAVLLTVAHTPLGAATSMDSLYYIMTGSNILAGDGIVHSSHSLFGEAQRPTTLWPPLYSVVVAGLLPIADWAGTSDVNAIAAFNTVLLIVSMLLIVRIVSQSAPVPVALAAAVVVSIAP